MTVPAPGGAGPGAAAPWLGAASALHRWMAVREYAGWDPYDYLSSPVLRRLSLGSRWLAVAWTQLGRRLPVQIRPALGVPRHVNPKTLALVLTARRRMAVAGEATGSELWAERLRAGNDGLVRALEDRAISTDEGAGWGYPFPWANRHFWAEAHTPNSVATAFVGHALWDLASVPGHRLARDGARFLHRGLNRVPGLDGETFAFTYTPDDQRVVHNASLLAASLLARVGRAGEDRDGGFRRDALRAARFTHRAQRLDGSWPYGTTARDDWADSFHTAYVLMSLDWLRRDLGTDEFDEAIERGLRYWLDAFFHGPAVGMRPGEAYPVDAHAVAVAILALLQLRHETPLRQAEPGDRGPARARRLARWMIQEMRARGGWFYYRKYRWGRNRLAYMRWGQAWMLRALSELAAHEARTGDRGRGRRRRGPDGPGEGGAAPGTR